MSSSSKTRPAGVRKHRYNLRPRPVRPVRPVCPVRPVRPVAPAPAAAAFGPWGKSCTKCKKFKPWSEFVHKVDPRKVTAQCHTCREISNRCHAKN
ncbi:uncharacterized protein N7483_012597 [Penicillium malachiteum]|uniref:uncharacterized protein n=1 Tax=Penicillium malachiteum TaxID=1324776 RepID=UPI00254968E7|nr:uncharacterized protein N7483_012597 [Penicillium malachiteum]KAJ5715416.1 hypothetical protein N7483_012597 [Penicillium malachiteum]